MIAALVLVAGGCGDDDPVASSDEDTSDETTTTGADPGTGEPPAIRIGAQDFGESAILAEVYGQALEANGYEVEQVSVGGRRDELLAAFSTEEVNLSLEYAASMLEHVNEGAGEATADAEETVSLLEGHLAELGLAAPEPSPAVSSRTPDDGTVVLEADNVVPIVSEELVDAYGNDILDQLDVISRSLDTASLAEMNRRFDVDDEEAEAIAEDFLAEAGLAP